MLKIGIVGCGFQAATIAGYLGIYGDDYEVTAVMDINFISTKAEKLPDKGTANFPGSEQYQFFRVRNDHNFEIWLL